MFQIFTYRERPLLEQDVMSLFLETYNKRVSEEYWRWRFLCNPFDSEPRIAYAINDNKLVSYYAVSPVEMTINGIKCKLALSNMTMTHPAHQGKGLFTQLANRLFDELKEDGYVGVFGFANRNSHYGFRKNLGWKDLAALSIIKCESPGMLIDFVDTNNATTNHIFCDDDLASLEHMSYSSAFVLPSRDSAFLRWRLIDNPENKYRLASSDHNEFPGCSILYKEYDSGADIMEIFYNRDLGLVAGSLRSALSNIAATQVTSISMWSNLHCDEHMLLEKMGFFESSFVTYFGVIPFDVKTKEALSTYESWHYRFIDSDVF